MGIMSVFWHEVVTTMAALAVAVPVGTHRRYLAERVRLFCAAGTRETSDGIASAVPTVINGYCALLFIGLLL